MLRTCPCNFTVLLTVQTIFIRNCTLHCRTSGISYTLQMLAHMCLCSNKVVSGNTAPNTHDRETQATSTRKHTWEGFKLTAEAFVRKIERGEVRFIWANRFVRTENGSLGRPIQPNHHSVVLEVKFNSKVFTLTMWHFMFACWYNNNFIIWRQKALLYFSYFFQYHNF